MAALSNDFEGLGTPWPLEATLEFSKREPMRLLLKPSYLGGHHGDPERPLHAGSWNGYWLAGRPRDGSATLSSYAYECSSYTI